MKLRLSPELTLPLDAVTDTFGILAVRGAGKSNSAAVMAEEMFKAKLPFVVVDPEGSWWGLRSSANGKGPGLPIPIFGGVRGDVPLERGGGALVADLVAEHRLSCVLDLDAFESEAARKQFLLDFARRLYAAKQRHRDPLHLFLEEADDYIPQKPMREEAQLLRAWENIVRRGRKRGIGCTLITQRSAVINKNVLYMAQTLIAMRTTGPGDRDAIEGWVKYHGQSREIVASLADLRDGEAWVWSPNLLRKTVRVQFRMRETFDSAATPKVAQATRAPATLADVDLGSIQKRMASTIEKAKAEDPRELRRRVAELERELSRTKKETRVAPPPRAEIKEIRAISKGDLRRVETLVERIGKIEDRLRGYSVAIGAEGSRLASAVAMADQTSRKAVPLPPRPAVLAPQPIAHPSPRKPMTQRPEAAKGQDGPLTGPQQRILDAIAWIESLGQPDADQAAAAFLAGYTIGGGAWNNPRGSLHTKGLVAYRPVGRIALTDEGRALARVPDTPLTTQELHNRVMQRLPGPERKLLKVLLENYPMPISNEELAAKAGYADGGGAFNNPRGRLRSLGLIAYPDKGMVVARPILFLER